MKAKPNKPAPRKNLLTLEVWDGNIRANFLPTPAMAERVRQIEDWIATLRRMSRV